MSWEILKDANGDWAFEEVAAAVHCIFTMLAAGCGVVLYLRHCIVSGDPPDLQVFGTGLLAVGGSVSAAVVAVGAAKKMRGDLETDRENRKGNHDA